LLNQIEEIITVYLKEGLVTRKDVQSLDSRPFARTLEEEFKKLGYIEARYIEIALSDFHDFSGALYNSSKYTYEQVKSYMYKNVLS